MSGINSASAAQETAQQLKALLREHKAKTGQILDDRADAARLDELRRLFAKEHASLQSTSSDNNNDNEPSPAQQKWQKHLKQARSKFLTQLSHRIRLGKRTAVRTFWGVVASSPRSCRVGGGGTTSKESSSPHPSPTTHANVLDEVLLLQWLQAMCRLPIWDQSIQRMVQNEFVQPYLDVQYYAMKGIAQAAQELYQQWQQRERQNDDRDGNTEEKENDAEFSMAAERFVQMLVMIPIAKTQAELDDQPNAYLFAPPSVPKDSINEIESEDDLDSDTDDDDDDDDDGDNDEGESDAEAWISSDDEEEDEQTPNAKTLPKQQSSAKKKRRGFPLQTVSFHRREWSRAWLAVLRLPCLPTHCLKQALQFLPQRVLPVVGQPLLFADFFMSAYSTGNAKNSDSNHNGVVPILALDGLFYLMVQHGLEYPQYYAQLYQLITPTLLQSKHKSRFLELLDNSISRNELLPAHIVAAMGKRLLQSALAGAPPPAILWSLALVSNWFRQHPETVCLLHRSAHDGDSIEDKFDKHATDPAKANALHSSLWELRALTNHYYPAVATLAASIGTLEESHLPLHKAHQDFGHLSYPSLLEQERKKRPKTIHGKSSNKSHRTPLTFAPPPAEGMLGGKDSVLGSILANPTKRAKKT